MNDLSWDAVAEEFAIDGSLRDIYVLDTDIDAWQRAWDGLRDAGYELRYYRGGQASELPSAAADAFPEEGQGDRLLSVHFAGVIANCHFFSLDEIEFDIDPQEVRGQHEFDALLAFMRLLSDAMGKNVVLTPENCPEGIILRARPNLRVVEYNRYRSH